LSGPLLHLRVATCLSARQLIKADSTGGRPFIDQLNAVWAKLPVVPPTLSISGGHNRLEFHANRLRNALTNAAIQRAMGTRTNDGLVAEESVNMYSEILPAGVTSYHPCNDYFDYTNTNHTGLVEDQGLALTILAWICVRLGQQ